MILQIYGDNMDTRISLSQTLSATAITNFLRPEQERTRIALALNRHVNQIRTENRVVVNNNSLVTFSIKPHFLKWLLLGREFYQAKFSNNVQLVAIVKLKIRRYY